MRKIKTCKRSSKLELENENIELYVYIYQVNECLREEVHIYTNNMFVNMKCICTYEMYKMSRKGKCKTTKRGMQKHVNSFMRTRTSESIAGEGCLLKGKIILLIS